MGAKSDVLTNAPAKLLELAEKGLHRLFFKASKVSRVIRIDKRKEKKKQELLDKAKRDEADASFATILSRNKNQLRLNELKQNNTTRTKELDQ